MERQKYKMTGTPIGDINLDFSNPFNKSDYFWKFDRIPKIKYLYDGLIAKCDIFENANVKIKDFCTEKGITYPFVKITKA